MRQSLEQEERETLSLYTRAQVPRMTKDEAYRKAFMWLAWARESKAESRGPHTVAFEIRQARIWVRIGRKYHESW